MSNLIYLPRTGLVITERCNLRCKLCAEYAPFYAHPPHSSMEQITRAIDIYFTLVDSVGDFSVLGGEPFLHKDVYNVTEYLKNYASRISRILILTNGAVIPSEEKLEKLSLIPEISDKLQISISDYDPSLSTHTAEVEQMCKKFNIKCRIIKYHGDDIFCDGWADFGDNSRKYHTQEEIREHSKNCNFRKNIYSNINFDGDDIYFSRCGRAYWRKYLNVTPDDTKDVIKFPDILTEEAINDTKAKIHEMLAAEYSDSCAFCNGLKSDSPRFKPAEQFTIEELREVRKRYARQ